jgi:DNA mismatch repair protein MutS2
VDSFTLDKIEFDQLRELLSGFCACSLGRSLALRITPSRNVETIARWQEQTAQMVDVLRDVGLPPFGGITDVRPALDRTKPGGGATGEEYAQIASTLEGSSRVREFLVALEDRFDALAELGGQLAPFDELVEAIRHVVGSDGHVLDTASRRLAEIRREMDRLDREIHEVAHSYVRNPEVARLLTNPNVTLHGDRYVLPVRADHRGRLPGVVHRASNTGATVFVEPNACVTLNNELADQRDHERREVNRLLTELGLRVSKQLDAIRDALRLLSQIDLLQAKAQYAYQNDMIRPELNESGQLLLPDARHPLLIAQARRQEKEGIDPEKRHPVVPIDVRLGQDFDLLVITGSNTGGKTVALKTVALLVVMHQTGMHIPASRGAELPVFQDVLIDIGDEQSLQQSLSTFGGHLKRLKYILNKAGKSSLVLLDELGAGTDPDEGGAIGQAVLDELRRIGCVGMISTHLSVLKAYAFTHDRVDNASVEFDTRTLSPTYRLLIGQPGESHAITVARRMGLPRRVTGEAKQYLSRQGKQFSKAIRATAEVRKNAEDARAEAHQARVAAHSQREDYEEKLTDIKHLRQELLDWLAALPDLRPGDAIAVPSMRKTGSLVRLELHRQVAVVEVDGLTVEVPLGELMPALGQDAVRRDAVQRRRQREEDQQRAADARREAEGLKQEFEKTLTQQRDRAKRFDRWLGAIGRMSPGDEVPIARKPGKAILTGIDPSGLKATVRTGEGEEITLSLQDLFPQTGPFSQAAREASGKGKRRATSKRSSDQGTSDEPIRRPRPDSKKVRKNVRKVLQVEPGEPVFVVPFNQRATLIRIDHEKDQAIVQAGAFEMQVALADLAPVSLRK